MAELSWEQFPDAIRWVVTEYNPHRQVTKAFPFFNQAVAIQFFASTVGAVKFEEVSADFVAGNSVSDDRANVYTLMGAGDYAALMEDDDDSDD